MFEIILGGIARDHRGQIRFNNSFDMSQVKRFYIIKNADSNVIRGWRGHRIEERWFYVIQGSFEINIVKIDNWEKCNKDLPVEKLILQSEKCEVLHILPGHATAIRAIGDNSELLVFGNYKIDHSSLDDYVWPTDYFTNIK